MSSLYRVTVQFQLMNFVKHVHSVLLYMRRMQVSWETFSAILNIPTVAISVYTKKEKINRYFPSSLRLKQPLAKPQPWTTW